MPTLPVALVIATLNAPLQLHQALHHAQPIQDPWSRAAADFVSAAKRVVPRPCKTPYDCEYPDVCCHSRFLGGVCCPAWTPSRQAIPIPID